MWPNKYDNPKVEEGAVANGGSFGLPGSFSEPSGFGEEYDRVRGNRLYGTDIWDNQYAQYMQMIEKYKGTSIYQQLLNNPYMQFQAYQPGTLESMFGSRSGMQDFYNGRFTQATEYVNQLADELRQQQYNSPAEQKLRENAAGINVDLNGGAQIAPGTAGDASPAVEQNPLSPDHGSDAAGALGATFDFASMGMNFVSGLTALIKGVQSIGMNFTQQGLLSTALSNSAMDVALKEEAAKWKFPTKSDGSVDYSAVPDLIIPTTTKKGRPKGAAGRALERARGNLYDEDGKPTSALMRAIREHEAGAISAQVRSGTGMATPGYSESIEEFAAGYSSIIVQKQIDALDWDVKLQKLDAGIKSYQQTITGAEAGVAEGIASANLKSSQAQARSAEAMADYTEGRFTGELGQSESSLQILENQLRSIEADIAKEQEETWKAIQDYISDPKHGRLGQFGITLLPGLRQEVDRIFESRREAVRARREALRGIGDSATKAIVGAVKP